MVNMSAMRPSGRTYALNLTTSASSALLIESTTNDQTNYVSLLNTGSGVAAIEMGNASDTVATPAIASTGNAGSFVLPAAMTFPLVIAAPKAPFYIKGISSGTNTLYITAVQAD
jgi:hypothetical protein